VARYADRLHGQTVAELEGRPVAEVFPPHARGEIAEKTRITDEQGHCRWESVHIRKDGTTFPVLVELALTMSPIRDASGAVVPFIRPVRLLVPSDAPTVPDWRPRTSTDTVKVDAPASLPPSPLPLDPEESAIVASRPASVPLDEPPELPEEPPVVPPPELLEPELLELVPPSSGLPSAPVATGWRRSKSRAQDATARAPATVIGTILQARVG
jgi:hypothetical protein